MSFLVRSMGVICATVAAGGGPVNKPGAMFVGIVFGATGVCFGGPFTGPPLGATGCFGGAFPPGVNLTQFGG